MPSPNAEVFWHALEAGQGDSPSLPEAAGLWVLFNLLGREPSAEEAEGAKAIGYMLSLPLHDWWD